MYCRFKLEFVTVIVIQIVVSATRLSLIRYYSLRVMPKSYMESVFRILLRYDNTGFTFTTRIEVSAYILFGT